MRSLTRMISALALGATLALPMTAAAQGLFSAQITVNGTAITGYEIEQRKLLLQAFNTPGDLDKVAREQLLDEALKEQIFSRAGLQITAESLEAELTAFAGRAELDLERFVEMLSQFGVDRDTFVTFVRRNVTWRDYIRSRYSDRVSVTDADVDAALSTSGGTGASIQVLLSEIILPAPPEFAEAAMEEAQNIAQIKSFDVFSSAAEQLSAAQSRGDGGRLSWTAIDNYPPAIGALLLELEPGDVTAPIPIENGIVLFQMRGVREVTEKLPTPVSLEYAALYLAGGKTEEGLRAAADVTARVDTCDDLYTVARDLAPEQLERSTLALSEIPQDVAIELAKLDVNEVSTNLTRADGKTLVYLMLCNRNFAAPEEIDREAVRAELLSQRLSGYADGLLENERASSTIVER
ncbi:peptidylprolyl isomerase [Marivivens sp. LCG002]|uniref:peptidylprolyl isomerase n=1 Tax=Marivivens sp. LCG002 TaxID=3051171 RepID=UPI0025579039|nr:peptidylprolyl isomerase [Marivivens sp. LCG002]WIV51886.1 peptidylprolyl isomerase [Marivivens sp. LCG002]